MTTNSLSPWAVRMYLVNWRVGIYAADLSCAGTGFVTIRRLRTATLGDHDKSGHKQARGRRAIAVVEASGLGGLTQPVRDGSAGRSGCDVCPPEGDDSVEVKTPIAQGRHGHDNCEQHDRSDESEVESGRRRRSRGRM